MRSLARKGAACAVVMLPLWAVATARRLDRLHKRVDHTRARMEALEGDPQAWDTARRFYDQAVADTRAVRLKPLVRILRLAGTAPMPEFAPLVPAGAPRCAGT